MPPIEFFIIFGSPIFIMLAIAIIVHLISKQKIPPQPTDIVRLDAGPDVRFSFPDVCVWCGLPAGQYVTIDTRKTEVRYAWNKYTTKWGTVLSIPYCYLCGWKADVTKQTLSRLGLAINVFSPLVGVLSAVLLARLFDSIVAGVIAFVIWVFLGDLLITLGISQILLPRFFNEEVRSDCKAHLRKKRGNWSDIMLREVFYTPGLSVWYDEDFGSDRRWVAVHAINFRFTNTLSQFRFMVQNRVPILPDVRNQTL